MMAYKVRVVHRQKAKEKGFQSIEFSTWTDIICQWLHSIGARSCAFTSEEHSDCIIILAEFAKEPDNAILADIVIQDGINTTGPLRLESYEPATLTPVLAAWRHMQQTFLKERNAVTDLLKTFPDQIESLVMHRTYFPPDRIGKMLELAPKFPADLYPLEKKEPYEKGH